MGSRMTGQYSHNDVHGAPVTAAERRDPVCGMSVRPESAAGFVDHAGVTYWFCSPSCVARFKADPRGVREPRPPCCAKPPAGPKAAEYTCPMHPEVVAIGARNLPHLRHGPRAAHRLGRRGREPRAARHDAPVLDQRGPPGAAVPSSSWATCSAGTSRRPGSRRARSPGSSWPWRRPSFSGAAGRSSSAAWASIVNRQPEHVHADRASGVGVAYLYSVVATLVPAPFPARFAARRRGRASTSKPPPSSPCSCCSVRSSSCAHAAARAARSARCSAWRPKTARRRRDRRQRGRRAPRPRAGRRPLRVRPGEKVPVDGVVSKGAAPSTSR